MRKRLAQWSPYADVIFANGSVVTVDEAFSIQQAIAVKDGRIIATGNNDEVLSHQGDDTLVIDLDGRTIVPGLQDSHIHLLPLGYQVTQAAELTHAEGAQDIPDAVRDVKERRKLRAGEWITGYRWDHYKRPDMVTRWQASDHRKDGQAVGW
jgi:predicted amidohydrolase YtcJ